MPEQRYTGNCAGAIMAYYRIMRCATFNVLADAYLCYGQYEYAEPDLLLPGARLPRVLQIIEELEADIIGLQEADPALCDALAETGTWQSFWSPKAGEDPDGCLTLVRRGIPVTEFETHAYSDGTGYVMQSLALGDRIFANTHIKWAPPHAPDVGANQARELLARLAASPRAIIAADSNDRPGGPVRALIDAGGFINVWDHEPTAFIRHQPVALDLLAVRGLRAERMQTPFRPDYIPNAICPSDHIPLMAHVGI